MPSILTISGSPSATSRTQAVLRHVGDRALADGHRVQRLAVRDLPAAPLLHARAEERSIHAAVQLVERADAIVVGTPVYKAAYSGLLKAFLDLLPQQALVGKTVLPLATGGSTAHVLSIDYALRPVLTSLGADRVLHGRFLLDQHVEPHMDDGATIAPEARDDLEGSVDQLLTALPPATGTAPTTPAQRPNATPEAPGTHGTARPAPDGAHPDARRLTVAG